MEGSVDAWEEGGGEGRKRVGEGVESLEFSLSSAEVRDSEEQECRQSRKTKTKTDRQTDRQISFHF